MKKMSFVLMMLVSVVGAQAAVYDWNGSAGDGDWNNTANWTVAGSSYTYPNEEFSGSEYTNQDCGEINITNGDTVSRYRLSPDGARDGSTTCHLTISNGSTLNLSLMWIADANPSVKGKVTANNGTLNVSGDIFDVGNDGQGTLEATNATITAGGQFRVGVGASAIGRATLTNSSLTTGDILTVGWANGADGQLVINGNSTVNTSGYHLRIAKEAGAKGEVTIADNADVDVNGIYMCDDSGSGAIAKLNVNGGKITTHYNVYVGDDGSGEAYVTVSGGEFEINGLIDIPWNTTGAKGHLTMNGGLMAITGAVNLGTSHGDGSGEGRLFMNGGEIRCNDLNFLDDGNKVKDSGEFDGIVVYTNGKLLVNQSNMSIADMNDYIDGGWIDVSGAASWSVTTIDVEGTDYTALVPEPGTIGLIIIGIFGILNRKR